MQVEIGIASVPIVWRHRSWLPRRWHLVIGGFVAALKQSSGW